MKNDQNAKTEPQRGSIIKRAGRILVRVTVTLGVIAGAVFAVQMGAAELTRRADAAPVPDAAPTVPVAASPLQIEDSYSVERAFIGQVEPQKTAVISFELPGRLQAILVEEGDHVQEGQALARQDVKLLQAEQTRLSASKEATEAQLRFALQTVERQSQLTERGFTAQAGLDEALARRDELLARIAETDAALADVAIRMGKAQISAPFEGRVTTRAVDGGETLGAGQEVLRLVELRRPQVRVGVPLDLTEEALAEAIIEIGGEPHAARLLTLRPDIDPVTRTRTALFEIDTEGQPAFGQTARLIVSEDVPATGIWVPTTTLKEGARGQWTVLMVDPDRVVRAASVEVLHSQSAQVFVRGAFPEGTLLVEEGPQRVTVGQRVTLQSSAE